MERNAPKGRRCDDSCVHPSPKPSQALCTVCHELFSGITNFDDHRKDGWCLAPLSIGLELKTAGVWGRTMDPAGLARLRAAQRG